MFQFLSIQFHVKLFFFSTLQMNEKQMDDKIHEIGIMCFVQTEIRGKNSEIDREIKYSKS